MSDLQIPEAFQRGRWSREGALGRQWRAALPSVVTGLCRQWALRPDGAVLCGDNGIAVPVRSGAEAAVLKISWPDHRAAHVTAALRWWDGGGAVRLLADDPPTNAALLEHVRPGHSLGTIEWRTALPIAARLLRRLAIPVPADAAELPCTMDTATWMAETVERRWDDQGRPFSSTRLGSVVDNARSLTVNAPELLVDHDLYDDNILYDHERSWVAIDPMVIVGDPEYQVAQLLWTRFGELADSRGVRRAFDLIVDVAGLDRDRALAWTLVRSTGYLLWGLSVGFDRDPARCVGVLDALGFPS